jgi:predicted nucleic acid-binding protein
LIYRDASALVKLIVPEAETNSLRHRLQGARPVSSALLGVETLRAVARQATQLLSAARSLLNGVDQVAVTPAILAEAQTLPPVELRSLDVIRLATACMLARDLDASITYDGRFAAARLRSLEIRSPA